ncbi:hypothetical protein K492DRAFT_141207 [Lichtheimia hyalospora FSU 10163]|nr:hypothetical protein K492DRAFT_141207 [Lichtheimia hyalospora FSU 10163]
MGAKKIKQIKADLGVEQGVSSISTKIINWCYQVSHSRHADYVDIQRVTSPMLVSAADLGDKTEIIAANVLHSLTINFSSNGSMDISLEDTFVHGVVGVLLESVFQPEPLLSYQWANGQLGVKRKRDASKLKPDFIVFGTPTSRKFNVGVAEVKPPGCANLSNDGESDLVKLGREMQYMLNQLINDCVQNPVVGGTLLQGCNINLQTQLKLSSHIYGLCYGHPKTLTILSLWNTPSYI